MRLATIAAASLIAASTALPLASVAQANILINIDKSAQHMSVTVDGVPKYEWAVSTGRPGYDTPNGTFKVNRMDADHLSQEWDNAPMPNTMFFDLHGHAIHGFFDVKHLGLPVSHGCVRLAPPNAQILFNLVKAEGMSNTAVVVDGHTRDGGNGPMARSRAPANEAAYSSQPLQVAPQYPPPQPPPYYAQPPYGQRYYAQPQPYYGQGYYGQPVYRQW
jgi:L,D-transpeptidase catalytic domain